MGSRIDPTLGRRGFLKGVVAAAGAAPVVRQSVVVAGLAGATVLADSRAGRWAGREKTECGIHA